VGAADIDALGPKADAALAFLYPFSDDLAALLRGADQSAAERVAVLDLIEAGWWFLLGSESASAPSPGDSALEPGRGGRFVGPDLLRLIRSAVESPDPASAASARPMLAWLLGCLYTRRGRSREALPLFSAAEAGFRRRQDKRREGWCIQEVGTALMELGDLDGATDSFRRALRFQRSNGNTLESSICCVNLGEVARLRRDYAEAEGYLLEAAGALSETERESQVGWWVFHNLAQVRLRLGDTEGARTALSRIMGHPLVAAYLRGGSSWGITDVHVVASALAAVAALAALCGQTEEAGWLAGVAARELETLQEATGCGLNPPDQRDWELNLALVQERRAQPVVDAAVSTERPMEMQAALRLAQSVLAGASSTRERAPGGQ
jgi:tetratricopeptide (TPR) repeat protein